MEATAYCPKGCCGSRHGRTATGRRAEYGVAAVDPRRIPLGTALYVDRYGFAIAADTGSAIKGNRIDLCFPTHREANRFGRRQVRVLILR
jgi:3D (Asp-Asp-Asp) domain-containing protein